MCWQEIYRATITVYTETRCNRCGNINIKKIEGDTYYCANCKQLVTAVEYTWEIPTPHERTNVSNPKPP